MRIVMGGLAMLIRAFVTAPIRLLAVVVVEFATILTTCAHSNPGTALAQAQNLLGPGAGPAPGRERKESINNIVQ